MSTRLIVNADDYGRTSAVSAGIRAAHINGIVTSTTVMANMPGIEVDLKAALRETPRMGLGVHLVLTADKPLLPMDQVSTLVNEKGHFFNEEDFLLHLKNIDVAQVKAEWKAQIDKFTSITGHAPDHLDSHHHVSFLTPELFRVMLELAQDYHCSVRYPSRDAKVATGSPYEKIENSVTTLMDDYEVRHPDHFVEAFYGVTATKDKLMAILHSLPEGIVELMCHPGYADTGLVSASSYARQRVLELTALASPDIKAYLKSAGIDLKTFADLNLNK
jgi:chitin disaccharide deacetylase